MLEYTPKDVVLYEAGLDKLMHAIAEKAQPETIWDKVKNTVETAIKTPGQIRDRFRQAKRIAEVRNEQGDGGNKKRSTRWAIKQTIFAGEAGVKKLSETTAHLVNEAFIEHQTKPFMPDAKKFNVDSQTLRQDLLARIQPEEIVRAKEELEAEQKKRRLNPIKIEFNAALQPTFKTAKAMSFGGLGRVVHNGKKSSGAERRQAAGVRDRLLRPPGQGDLRTGWVRRR